ncbi:MAG: hypothetical protein K9N49_02555 [Candidatus Marinimicrobia bacterium]|nr:hypothetical protein [Candidatus Neomarinimicrobiota bacterium]
MTIEDDILDRARALVGELHRPFRRIVNEALRAGLQAVEKPVRSRPYQTHPRKLGLKAGRSLDNIQELIAQIEGGESTVILVDANILLYAEDQLSPSHDAARAWWDAELSGSSPVCLCWTVLGASDFSRFPGIRWRNPLN